MQLTDIKPHQWPKFGASLKVFLEACGLQGREEWRQFAVEANMGASYLQNTVYGTNIPPPPDRVSRIVAALEARLGKDAAVQMWLDEHRRLEVAPIDLYLLAAAERCRCRVCTERAHCPYGGPHV